MSSGETSEENEFSILEQFNSYYEQVAAGEEGDVGDEEDWEED
jgi:hypothetical protein